MNSSSYIWQITNTDAIYKLLNASVGESFESEVFTIGGLKWLIMIYPNGWNKLNIGCFNVCIKLLTMSSSWKKLILCRTIKCVETMSSCTSIASYYKNGDSMCWKERTLLLSELTKINSINSLNQITFNISINILKIICKKNNEIIYPSYSSVNNPSTNNTFDKYNHKQNISWKINSNIINKFKNSYYSKSFESNKYYNDMWCIRCYPNGINKYDKGFMGLYLTLCALPPNISAIKVLYTFRCSEFKNITHSRIKNFSYDDKSSWGVSRFIDNIHLNKHKSLNICVDITIMNEYDKNNKEITSKYITNTNVDNVNVNLNGSGAPTQVIATVSNNDYLNVNQAINNDNDEKVTDYDHDTITSNITNIGLVLSPSDLSSAMNILSPSIANNHNRDITVVNSNANNINSNNDILYYIKKEICSIKAAYNTKLNSLYSIATAIQINNDKLTEQNTKIMKTVNAICSLISANKKKYNTKNNGNILQLTNDIESIKSWIIMQQSKEEHDAIDDIYNDAADDNPVKLWLMNTVKLAQYIPNFSKNGFDDIDIVKEMTMNELDIIGIKKLGHKLKLIKYIKILNEINSIKIDITDDITANNTPQMDTTDNDNDDNDKDLNDNNTNNNDNNDDNVDNVDIESDDDNIYDKMSLNSPQSVNSFEE